MRTAVAVIVILAGLCVWYFGFGPSRAKPDAWLLRVLINDSAHTMLTQECTKWQTTADGLQFDYTTKNDSVRSFTMFIPASRITLVTALHLNATKAVKK